MVCECICNVFKDLENLNLFKPKERETFVSKITFNYQCHLRLTKKEKQEIVNNKSFLGLPWTFPIRADVSIDAPLLMK